MNISSSRPTFSNVESSATASTTQDPQVPDEPDSYVGSHEDDVVHLAVSGFCGLALGAGGGLLGGAGGSLVSALTGGGIGGTAAVVGAICGGLLGVAFGVNLA